MVINPQVTTDSARTNIVDNYVLEGAGVQNRNHIAPLRTLKGLLQNASFAAVHFLCLLSRSEAFWSRYLQ